MENIHYRVEQLHPTVNVLSAFFGALREVFAWQANLCKIKLSYLFGRYSLPGKRSAGVGVLPSAWYHVFSRELVTIPQRTKRAA
jgi:hypothetical protein